MLAAGGIAFHRCDLLELPEKASFESCFGIRKPNRCYVGFHGRKYRLHGFLVFTLPVTVVVLILSGGACLWQSEAHIEHIALEPCTWLPKTFYWWGVFEENLIIEALSRAQIYRHRHWCLTRWYWVAESVAIQATHMARHVLSLPRLPHLIHLDSVGSQEACPQQLCYWWSYGPWFLIATQKGKEKKSFILLHQASNHRDTKLTSSQDIYPQSQIIPAYCNCVCCRIIVPSMIFHVLPLFWGFPVFSQSEFIALIC